ncbi:hypothetical protein IW140_005264 [Coemansia sp. RSA 1813]|nr:hypothetical protein LPJ74_002827 [Coemansia sp. RSA 1843]KAJ2565628.1 hypothetical protein IW140_005264 [Coemansia sp. RSA 1813]
MTLHKRDSQNPSEAIAPIACFAKACLPASADWLTSVPNGIVGFVLGILLVIVGIWRVDKQWRHCSIKYPLLLNVIAIVELFFSMALRCSLGRSVGNKTAMYKASLFTGYHAAVMLTLVLAVFWRHIYLNHDRCASAKSTEQPPPTSKLMKNLTASIAVVVFFGLPTALAVLSASFALTTGLQFATVLGALLGIEIIAMAISSFVALRRNSIASPLAMRFQVLMSLVVVLLLLWVSFTIARANVPLDNVARTSQTLYYLFAYVPLILACLVMTLVESNRPT